MTPPLPVPPAQAKAASQSSGGAYSAVPMLNVQKLRMSSSSLQLDISTGSTWFPPNKRPTGVRAGDRAVINGSGRRGFFAVVEVISTEPEPNQAADPADRRRWPWILRYKLLVAIRADEHAPSLEDVGWENPRSLRRQPHVRIDRGMYERISQAIVEGAADAVAA